MHIDIIGPHVQHHHYDLMDPEGAIILPQCWDAIVKPDLLVSMHMWPLQEIKDQMQQHPPHTLRRPPIRTGLQVPAPQEIKPTDGYEIVLSSQSKSK